MEGKILFGENLFFLELAERPKEVPASSRKKVLDKKIWNDSGIGS
jgi:hypothetical protein